MQPDARVDLLQLEDDELAEAGRQSLVGPRWPAALLPRYALLLYRHLLAVARVALAGKHQMLGVVRDRGDNSSDRRRAGLLVSFEPVQAVDQLVPLVHLDRRQVDQELGVALDQVRPNAGTRIELPT